MNTTWRNFLIFIVVIGIVGYLIIQFSGNSDYQDVDSKTFDYQNGQNAPKISRIPQNINAIQQNGTFPDYPIRADGKVWLITIASVTDTEYSNYSEYKIFSDNRNNLNYRIFINWDTIPNATDYSIAIFNNHSSERYFIRTKTNFTYFSLQGLTYYTWTKKHITYQVDIKCFLLNKMLINKSFFEISESVDKILTFEEVDKNGDINLICHKNKPTYYVSEDSDVLGLSRNSYDGWDINGSQIDLYGAVSLAVIEHEIIHSLGISQHSVWGKSIMSSTEYLDVEQVLDKKKDNDTINTLKEMYSN